MQPQEKIIPAPSWEITTGDSLAVLQTMGSGSVNTCITSPPYYGLRDYGVAGQIGLEATPDEWVAKMVAVFAEVRRVLRDDGTMWVNVGDSYNANIGAGFNAHPKTRPHLTGEGVGQKRLTPANRNTTVRGASDWKPKDLMGIPWMLAFALRADGWYLRQDIIWAKLNPMPESVRDRCTKSHEYLFLLSKSPRYYFDREAMSEPVSANTHSRISKAQEKMIRGERDGLPRFGGTKYGDDQREESRTKSGNVYRPASFQKLPNGWDTGAGGHGSFHRNGRATAEETRGKTVAHGQGIKNNESFAAATILPVDRRNKRSVWTVSTRGFKEAHFATFPPALIEPCVLAGARVGGLVLDPFSGAATTGLVALRHGRDYRGIELNPEYVAMSERRLKAEGF